MKGKLTNPVAFTILGFRINSLIDEGETISLDEISKHIQNRTLWTLLEEKLTNRIISIYDDNLRNEFLDYFKSCDDVFDPESDFDISNNGYCLLISYLLEAVQNGVSSGRFPSLKENN